MKPERINQLIAEYCGKKYHKPTEEEIKSGSYYQYESNYCADLNAMHEMENMLKIDQIGDYENRLYGITNYRDSVIGEAAIFWSQHSLYRNIHATASQRAEAFLKTIGKWEEE